MRRIVTITGLLVLLMALAAAPALAQDPYPPEGATAAVSDTVVTPGDTITVVGEGWLPDSEVAINLQPEGRVLDNVLTNDEGAFAAEVAIPGDVAPGDHALELVGLDADGQPRTVTIAFTVVEAAGVAPGVTAGTGLPATGSNTALALAGAVGLLGVGGGAVYAARRRERAHTAG